MQEFLLAFFLSYVVHTLGLTIGYHRLLSHRSFHCSKAVEYFFVASGYLAFQTSPIWWATLHRAHHRYSDTAKDPHALMYGFRRCVYGWIFDEKYPDHIDPEVMSKDLIKDPVYRFLDQGGNVQRGHILNGFLCFLFRVPILMIWGLPAALGSLAAGLIIQQVTLYFNLLSHIPKIGYRNFATTDDSVSNFWLALITMGEGWHNNHHGCPGSAKAGMRVEEIDPAWYTIAFLRKIGLVSWANDTAFEQHCEKLARKALGEVLNISVVPSLVESPVEPIPVPVSASSAK